MATTIDHKLAEFAIKKTCEAVKHDKVLVFSDRVLDLPFTHSFGKIIRSFGRKEWNDFIFKELYKFVDTDHVLIIQPDGFGVNASFWNDSFLEYDFLAAPFSTETPIVKSVIQAFDLPKGSSVLSGPKCIVGAGGLTLRSKKLLEITARDEFKVSMPAVPSFKFKHKDMFNSPNLPISNIGDVTQLSFNVSMPEDFTITIKYRDQLENDYGIKFGSLESALNFSNEDVSTEGCSFGFHGFGYIPFYLTHSECKFYIDNMRKITPKEAGSVNYRKLLSSLFRVRYFDLFEELHSKLGKIAMEKKSNA